VIATLVGQGYRPKQCCRILGVASGGYFRWKLGPISQAELRRQWLRQAIRQAHRTSGAEASEKPSQRGNF
jgi:hypothetical protein